MKMKMNTWYSYCLILVLLFHVSEEQQTYLNNRQLDCNSKDYNFTLGNACNGIASSCETYLTFRSNPPYNTPPQIAYLLGSTPSEIATANNISDVQTIPTSTIIIVPVDCSCSGPGPYYQHNSSYILKDKSETYFTVSNDTYQGLTTCQSMIAQNPQKYWNLSTQLNLTVPLRCACPTSNQTSHGIKYLLTYIVTWRDTISSIAQMFGISPNNQTTILDANQLSDNSIIYPFTPILVPLFSKPRKIQNIIPPPSPPPTISPTPTLPSHSSNKWVFIGVAIGVAILLLLLTLLFFYFLRQSRKRKQKSQLPSTSSVPTKLSFSRNGTPMEINSNSNSKDKSWSISSQGVQRSIESLIIYKLEDLQKATNFFSEDHRMKGSVYKGLFKGDHAAVKVMKLKGDIIPEINVLKKINHRNIIRLSGYCMHPDLGNAYLVYEYAENGSLRDCLHDHKHNSNLIVLTWKQRIQIACDIADALNYLHSYTNPPYIHKNLTTSNILLDGNFRAKISNFGSARSVDVEDDENGFQFTRHVVGTQGYMAPEYIDNGLVTPKLDVFAFGVVILELLSGKEAVTRNKNEDLILLSTAVSEVIDGDNNVMERKRLIGFMDTCLDHEYPLELAFSMLRLANTCVAPDLTTRPTMSEAFVSICKIFSSSMDWDPSDNLDRSESLRLAR